MFDNLSDAYEAMVDWPKRLAHEAPFYRRLFETARAKRVVDVACGTGHHAAMFHNWGLEVEGADLSPEMIERAQTRFGQPDGLRWVVRGFQEPIAGAGKGFDIAVCVGNSLALANDLTTIQTAIRQMLAAVHPGGAVVVQVLNLWRLAEGPCLWQKSLRAKLEPGEVLLLKGIHRCGGQGQVDMVVIDPANGGLLKSESTPFVGLEAEWLEQMADDAGARKVEIFGGYQDQPYQRETSVDLVMIAEK